MLQQQVFDLGGRDVFALPAIGVTEAINKLCVAETDVAQQITGVEKTVTLG